MSDKLLRFLRARLDEDEAAAEAAAESDWWGAHAAEFASANLYDELGDAAVEHASWWPGDADFAHIARHDPARVLREVEAKRAILAQWEHSPAGSPVLVNALYQIAAVYSDHPDHRPGWAPGG